MKWYVIYVRGGKEEEVREVFEKEGMEAFCPKMEVLYRKQGEEYYKEKLMFPNYVFMKSELSYAEFHEKYKEIRRKKQGVVKEMKFDNEGTSALYEDEREFLQEILDESYVMRHSIGVIKEGSIRIREGSLKGYEEYIRKIDRHKRRGKIEVRLHGESKEIQVSLEIVEKN